MPQDKKEKHQTRRVRVLVKAFPQPSTKHEETVCVAAIAEDTREFLRLFPIRYRRLSAEHRFERFDQVTLTATKAESDPRPESFRVDEDSIHVTECVFRGCRSIVPRDGGPLFRVMPVQW